jgi:hypothetical protein
MVHHDHYAPSPQACRQPYCSKLSLMALSDQSEGGRERRGMRHRGDKSMSSGWRRGDSRAESIQPLCGETRSARAFLLQLLEHGCMFY